MFYTKLLEVEQFALIGWSSLSEGLVQSLINGTNLLRKVYYARHGDKTSFAFLEEQQAIFFEDQYVGHWDYIGLLYDEFPVSDILGTDACDLARIRYTGIDSKCSYDDTTNGMKYVIIYDPQFEQVGAAWSDFTSKLRQQ